MADYSKPSVVLYSDLKSFARMPHKRAAQLMLTTKGYAALDDSRISRDVVNAEPGSSIAYSYRSFKAIAQDLAGILIPRHGNGEKGRNAVLKHYGDTTSLAVIHMCQALSNYGMKPGVYLNLLDRIAFNGLATSRQKCILSIMLFCACGVLGDPEEAVRQANLAFEDLHAIAIGTVQASDENDGVFDRDASAAGHGVKRLGLLRVMDGVAVTPLYELALPPNSTTIGSLNCTITDVAADVSRRHLSIWHDGRHWVCQGLGSLNGTTLISKTGGTTTVELARNLKGSQASPVVPISPGDVLCLGTRTRFLVTSLTVEH